MSHTPGPWRWADWSAYFGTREDANNRIVLERNATHLHEQGEVVRTRLDGVRFVARLEEPLDNKDNAELIRRAPELAAALIEMLEMFAGNMDREDAERFRALATVP